MAPHMKIGNDKCPRCGELGYKRQKPVRSRKTGAYVYRYYFRHNDRNIKEHYVDNFLRVNESEKHPWLMEAEDHFKKLQDIPKIMKRIMTFPLNEEERLWYKMKVIWFCDNILLPVDIIIEDIKTGRFNLSPEDKKVLWEFMIQNYFSKDNVFLRGYEYLYNKYDRPRRLDRNERRNKKLSEWHGRRTNDFTGIDIISEPPKSELKA